MSNSALKTVAANAPAAQPKKPSSFPAMLDAYKGEIARALPRHLSAERMARIALTCFRMTPKLAECDPASVFAAVIQAAQLGLEPGLLGQAYLIPYKDKCQLIPGYQGLVELVRRSGLVESFAVYVVYERDTFSVRFGTDPAIEHVPFLDGDPGAAKLSYGVAKLKGGGTHVEIMTKQQIERIRDRSSNVQTAKKYGKTTPWDTDADEMWRKTVARRMCKYLPKSPELATALALDDAATRGGQALTTDDAIAGVFVPPAIDAESSVVDEATGEIVQAQTDGPNYADVRHAIDGAKDGDAVDAAESLVDSLPTQFRAELHGLCGKRREALEAAARG